MLALELDAVLGRATSCPDVVSAVGNPVGKRAGIWEGSRHREHTTWLALFANFDRPLVNHKRPGKTIRTKLGDSAINAVSLT